MKINTEDLIKIYQSYILSRIPLSTQACPASEEISSIFFSAGHGEKNEKLLDHITNCSLCFQEFHAYLQMAREEKKLLGEIEMLFRKGTSEVPGPADYSSNYWEKIRKFALSWKFALATALCLSFATLVLIFTIRQPLDKIPGGRSSRPGHIELLEPRSGQGLSIPMTFKWTEIEGRDHFVLEIFDESLALVWKSPKIYENVLMLPQEVENGMKAGRTYFWMVTAYFPNGMKLESPLEETFVSRGPNGN